MEQSLSHFCGPEQNAPALFIIRPNGWPEKKEWKDEADFMECQRPACLYGEKVFWIFSIKPMRTCSAFRRQKCSPASAWNWSWKVIISILVQRAKEKGYSGTALFCKEEPLSVAYELPQPAHAGEGRVITAEFKRFYLVNVYTPNSQRGLTRLDYRMEWEDAFLSYVRQVEEKKPVIICGDMNVAHWEIDLKNPKTNVANAGFTPQEREKMTALQQAGYLDSFRYFSIRMRPVLLLLVELYVSCAGKRMPGSADRLFSRVPRKLGAVYERCQKSSNEVMGSDQLPSGIDAGILRRMK